MTCAAALANVEIWRDEPVAERIATLSARQATGLQRFRLERGLLVRPLGS